MRSKKNIPWYYRLPANIYYIKYLTKLLLDFRRTYSNYFEVMVQYLKNSYPIEVILKNGEHFVLANSHSVFFIASIKKHHKLEYDIINDIVTMSSISWLSDDKIKVKFQGGVTNGDMINVFLENEYEDLPVREKTVVDVGSNIGDSPIYFVLRGASKIIALEPFPRNYELAKQNIKLNNFSEKINILLAGCSSTSDHITIDPNLASNVDSAIHESKQGVEVSLMTLKDIINNYNIPDGSILKLDCEGCEYDTILSSSSETLRKFSHILIEYHYGYQNLKDQLEKYGFRISITKPMSQGFIGTYGRRLRQLFTHTKQKVQSETDKQKTNSKCNKELFGEYIGYIHAVRTNNF